MFNLSRIIEFRILLNISCNDMDLDKVGCFGFLPGFGIAIILQFPKIRRSSLFKYGIVEINCSLDDRGRDRFQRDVGNFVLLRR